MLETIKKFKSVFLILGILGTIVSPKVSYAYPVFAQNAYQNPREATGRIVCANCHLAQKPTEIEVPQAVLPDTVFETVVSVPYDLSSKQITAAGTKGGLNVGAVVILPEGFKLAPKERLSDEIKAKTKGVFIQPYSKEKQNILVVGPISGDKNQDIIFPILSPDPATNKEVNYLNYPIYVGANRGRGQVYPTGEKSNNTALTSTAAGKVTAIESLEQGKKNLIIAKADGENVTLTIPAALDLVVKVNDIVKVDQPLTLDPNVGGFGQTETEIILQNPNRVKGMIVFFFTVTVAQILLVLKKKQFEKVQAAEMNF
jgi:apocytochrome f|uniref:Cytochrome f n=2 Tax=Chrysochromulina TaxID=35140 RepID=A0A075DWV5_9EUKA|nr:cytochrome f [Chrysochromulina parva]AHY04387.1 cytochrome f [Chrysochromulina tobinii]AUS84414.1 cytochrome f [Chrysochromulina parva]